MRLELTHQLPRLPPAILQTVTMGTTAAGAATRLTLILLAIVFGALVSGTYCRSLKGACPCSSRFLAHTCPLGGPMPRRLIGFGASRCWPLLAASFNNSKRKSRIIVLGRFPPQRRVIVQTYPSARDESARLPARYLVSSLDIMISSCRPLSPPLSVRRRRSRANPPVRS